jgi:YVTN family beta-propeller protein
MARLPTGTVTFVFTDIEGSTRLVKRLRERWAEALARHQLALREAFAAHGGREVDTQGDSFFFAFSSAREAVAAAVEGQRAIAATEWPDGVQVRARMGVHTAQASLADGRYVGVGVHRAARICAAGHGGQVLVSQATRELLEDEEDEERGGAKLRELGVHRLKDLDRPVHLYQVVAPGLDSDFPPLRAERGAPRRRRLPLAVGAAALAVAAVAASALLLLRDSRAPVVVPANSVAVIDPDGNEVIAAVPVGESPGPIVAGLGAVWVFNWNDLTVSKLDPTRRQTVGVVPGVTEGATAREAITVALLAAGEGALWTGHALTLRRSEPGRLDVLRAIDISRSTEVWTGITTGLGRVWLSGYAPRLMEIDPDRGTVEGIVRLEATEDLYSWSAVAVGLRSVWVAFGGSGEGSLVFRYDPVTGDIGRTPVDGSTRAIAVGRGAVWAADTAGDALVRIRPRPFTVSRRIPVGDEPVGVAVGMGSVWTANAGDGTVSRIDPATHEVVSIRVGHRPQGVVVANGLVWVSVRSA